MKRNFTFRVEDELWDKFSYISNKEKRSLNAQLELLVEKHIKSFEKENGLIVLETD